MPEKVWYHIILTFYGNWLPGDSRGFRTRNHHTHIEGDYKNPPPDGLYDGLLHHMESILKQEVVILSETQQGIVGKAMKEKLESLGVEIETVAVAGTHLHFLAKYPAEKYRQWTGLAKKHTWFILRDIGFQKQLWAKKGKELLIRDNSHWKNVRKYILAHRDEGAWIWENTQTER